MFEGKLKRYIQIHPVIFKITACEFEVDSRVKKNRLRECSLMINRFKVIAPCTIVMVHINNEPSMSHPPPLTFTFQIVVPYMMDTISALLYNLVM